jgi:hypothetical protein
MGNRFTRNRKRVGTPSPAKSYHCWNRNPEILRMALSTGGGGSRHRADNLGNGYSFGDLGLANGLRMSFGRLGELMRCINCSSLWEDNCPVARTGTNV